MASSSGPLNEGLQCSICLDVFTDPVTTPCGHNFCRTCLNKRWTNTQTCFCPSCKETFSRRPCLEINTTLTKVVQHFRKHNQDKSDVFCDFCDGRKEKAVKSCLTCQSSYCETHLEPHHRVPRLKKHKLINAVENLEDYIRQRLNNQQVQTQKDEQQMIQNKMKPIQKIRHSVEMRKTHGFNDFFLTSRTVHISNWIIIGLLILLVAVLFILPKQYAMSTDPQSCSDDSRITWLKQEITELEQHSHTEDHLHLQQVYSLLNTENWTEITSGSDEDVYSLKRALTLLKKQLNEKLCQIELKCVQKFAVDVTLDPDAANPYLILSEDGKQVSCGDTKQDVPENPKRFYTLCVLAKEGFSSGRFYYEVQVKGKNNWDLGVARESINRKEKITLTPEKGFWTVWLRNENQYAALESPSISLSLKVKPEKVGVFVDYEEGLVSFYDVGSRSHIYSFTGQIFADKLYPYFSPYLHEGGKNSKPLIITPVS